MADNLEKGMTLQAMYSDGEFYKATVVDVSSSQKRAKAPVKVRFIGYEDDGDEWKSLDKLKSKRLPKSTGKAKAKAAPSWDYESLTKGMRVQAESEGKYFAAEIVAVSKQKGKANPVKVHWVGYTKDSDEWVGGDRLRSKNLTKANAKVKAKADGPRRFGMPPQAKKYLLVKPKITAPLDPKFAPLVLGKKKYLEAVKECADKTTLEWALPRATGCARYSLPVFPDSHKDARASSYLAGVLIQEMIWQRSASSLSLFGPAKMCAAIKKMYSEGGMYEFEVKSMPNVCGTPESVFEVKIVESAAELPEAKEKPESCGKEANGKRLAFDLGKSDIKTVVIQDGKVLDSKETEWDVTNPDPDYHFKAILDAMRGSLERAKMTGKDVQAIGGSATGTVGANNEATWCDIFPNVPPDVYKAKVVDIFQRIAKEIAGDVPLKVINDGEVTALAAFQKIQEGNIMGISMGSSEGGGYANKDGNLLGWINELCYMRLDMNPRAPTDPWTKGAHTGLSHLYLGQRGATKLAPKAGIELPAEMTYPHKDMCTIRHENHAQCLKKIQEAMKDTAKEPEARKIYETVGVYLGYGLAQYMEFYKIDHVMILGRVSKGTGGDLMLDTAKKVLQEEFPELKAPIFHTADDHFKAVGQCIAAAALPSLK